jgi:hypothetical protein
VHHDQVPATLNERRRGQRPGHHDQVPCGASGIGLGTTIKYPHGAAGIGLGATIKPLRRTTSAAAGNGLGNTMKHLLNHNAGTDSSWSKANYKKAGQKSR